MARYLDPIYVEPKIKKQVKLLSVEKDESMKDLTQEALKNYYELEAVEEE